MQIPLAICCLCSKSSIGVLSGCCSSALCPLRLKLSLPQVPEAYVANSCNLSPSLRECSQSHVSQVLLLFWEQLAFINWSLWRYKGLTPLPQFRTTLKGHLSFGVPMGLVKASVMNTSQFNLSSILLPFLPTLMFIWRVISSKLLTCSSPSQSRLPGESS